MKLLKIIILPIMIPVAFIVIGVIGAIAFVNMLFDEDKRRTLLGI